MTTVSPLASILRGASDELFRLSLKECAAEARALNAANGFEPGSDRWFVEGEVRPIFFTGDPDAVKAQSYFIVISMNPKFEVGSKTASARLFAEQVPRLNEGAASHYAECASHFAPARRPHSFFGTLQSVSEAFARALKLMLPSTPIRRNLSSPTNA